MGKEDQIRTRRNHAQIRKWREINSHAPPPTHHKESIVSKGQEYGVPSVCADTELGVIETLAGGSLVAPNFKTLSNKKVPL